MSASFGEIVQEYSRNKESGVSCRYVDNPTLESAVGDLTNKALLDVGCGWGYYARKWAAMGGRVSAFDSSARMVGAASKFDQQSGLQVSYYNMCLKDISWTSSFEVVFANFVLNFMQSTQDLAAVCKLLYRSLKEGGRLVGLVPSGDSSLSFTHEFARKYGWRMHLSDGMVDGQDTLVSFHDNDGAEVGRATMTWYANETYTACLKEAGFANVQLRSPTVSADGLRELGEEFWLDLLKPPKAVLIYAEKC